MSFAEYFKSQLIAARKRHEIKKQQLEVLSSNDDKEEQVSEASPKATFSVGDAEPSCSSSSSFGDSKDFEVFTFQNGSFIHTGSLNYEQLRKDVNDNFEDNADNQDDEKSISSQKSYMSCDSYNSCLSEQSDVKKRRSSDEELKIEALSQSYAELSSACKCLKACSAKVNIEQVNIYITSVLLFTIYKSSTIDYVGIYYGFITVSIFQVYF